MSLKEKVALGAKLLDKVFGPEWACMIPTETFIMKDPCNCVLHYVYSDYCIGTKTLGLQDHNGIDDLKKERDHGFDCLRTDNDPDYDEWESYWVDEIRERIGVLEEDQNF